MNKKVFKSSQLKSDSKTKNSLASNFIIKRNSVNRRVHTEAYDPLEEKEKLSLKKLVGDIGMSKGHYLNKSVKKPMLTTTHQIRKSAQLMEHKPHPQLKSTLSKKIQFKYSKERQPIIHKSIGIRGSIKKADEFKKHMRLRTEVYEQEKDSNRINEIYKKLSSISVLKKVETDPKKKYKIVEAIGKGTFGVVYKAHNIQTRQQVAIKKVLQDKRYKNRQLQIMQMLHHPNVLQIKDFYYTNQDNQQFLNVVMDFYDQSLYDYNRQKVRKGEYIKPLLVKLFSYQMFKGINYLASISVAHRDIKPHNILIRPDTNKLVICDFGSAKQLISTQSNLAYICSRCYRAPQLIFGATDYTPQIDMWSIGCVIVQMINGEPPFLGNSQLEQLVQIMKVLGTPSKQIVLQMNSNYNIDDYKFPSVPSKQWRKVLRSKTDPLLVDLIEKIMVYSPLRRLTPFEAMSHQYFDDLRDQKKYKQIVNLSKCKGLHDYAQSEIKMDKYFIEKLKPLWL